MCIRDRLQAGGFPEGICVLGERDQSAAVFDVGREERGIRRGRGAGRCKEVQKIKKSQREPENESRLSFFNGWKVARIRLGKQEIDALRNLSEGKTVSICFFMRKICEKQHKTRHTLSYV